MISPATDNFGYRLMVTLNFRVRNPMLMNVGARNATQPSPKLDSANYGEHSLLHA